MAFNRDNRSGGGRDFGRRDFGGRGQDRQMFKTTCSNCGKECEVPFKPTGSKPVYCSECFRTMGGGPDSRRSDDRGPRRSSFGDRDSRPRNNEQPQSNAKFDELNAKLDKILAMLNSGSSEKTVKAPTSPKPEVVVETRPPQVEAPLAPEMPELPEVPQDEKMVEDMQLQPEEPTIIPEKKKRAPRKTTPLPIPE